MHVKHSAQSVVHKEPQEMAAVVTSPALSPVHRPLYSCLHISLVFHGPVYLLLLFYLKENRLYCPTVKTIWTCIFLHNLLRWSVFTKILIFIICFNSCLRDQFFIFLSKILYATPFRQWIFKHHSQGLEHSSVSPYTLITCSCAPSGFLTAILYNKFLENTYHDNLHSPSTHRLCCTLKSLVTGLQALLPGPHSWWCLWCLLSSVATRGKSFIA